MTSIPRAASKLGFTVLILVIGLYAGLPWLAPVLMHIGWMNPARIIYALYSTQCHQMAQRSYFLFGPKFMYTISELQAAGVSADPLALRAFSGTPDLGWKVAWSDRMTAMYTSLWVGMLTARGLGSRLRPLPVWGLAAMLLPLAVDGTTHFISDFAGIGQGFRDSNAWLRMLTGHRLVPGFAAGDAWGSFNADLRLLSGILFGLALAWFIVPRLLAFQRALRLRREVVPDGRPGEAMKVLTENPRGSPRLRTPRRHRGEGRV